MHIDRGITNSSEISTFYDSIITKLVAHADNQDSALMKLQKVICATQLHMYH
ncbi:hypothetical protein [Candidatus Pantoea carbekii]|uniref:Biotin carboxylase C-terminal domain-containing protein n=1 Tax=Candidatus Pantoea carbekii TaxID=1235990 RepID=U3U2V8_9GAMM|nr:hypothetical protein HHS_05160 [Candidatus Pantoea carbekii]